MATAKRGGVSRNGPTVDDVHGSNRLAQTYTIPGYAILPLRLFLGITFLYAGIQKITDGGFLRPGAPTYIGAQILSFSHGSPIRIVLLHLMEHAQAIGILTIVGEIAIGSAILLGLFTRVAALSGLVLNMGFFLSASWNVSPYFYGSDIVFVVAWLTLALTGPGAYAVDEMALPWIVRQFPLPGWVLFGPLQRNPDGNEMAADATGVAPPLLSRTEALTGGAAAVLLVVLGLIPRARARSPLPSSSASATGGSGPGRKIGNISQLPPNSAGIVNDPATGDPAVVIRLSDKQLVAYDAVCTHAGCTVAYDPQTGLLECPCHGGAFDPAHGAQVVGGPPPTPLSKLPIRTDSQGNIYLLS